LIISHLLIPPLVQIMRVKIKHENEEPSTQRRTKARHDPAALRAVQEALGQEGSQRSSRPRRGDPPPSYAEGSDEEIEEEEDEEEEDEEERTKSDGGEEEDDTYEQPPPPPSLLAAMERGRLRRKHATRHIPRKAIKPPVSNKAVPLLAFLVNTNKE
jgi:hypothetical protein